MLTTIQIVWKQQPSKVGLNPCFGNEAFCLLTRGCSSTTTHEMKISSQCKGVVCYDVIGHHPILNEVRGSGELKRFDND